MNSEFINMGADDVYEVEKILRKKFHPSKGVLYLVKWKHFPNSENTWEPPENFSQKLIDIYESTHKNKKRKISSTTTTTTTTTTSSSSCILSTSGNATTSSLFHTSDQQIPSSSSSHTSSCSSSATLLTIDESRSSRPRGKVRPRKNSTEHRQLQLQIQMHIQQQQQQPTQNHILPHERLDKQQLAVFNPVGTHTLPIIKEVVYEPELSKEPIIVTDVTAKDMTVTISECNTQEGFFQCLNP